MLAVHPLTPPAECLASGDAALVAALDQLAEARSAYGRGGRADLAGLVGSAASLLTQAHHIRAFEPNARRARDPADWFLD
jgi:hypothetical protein